MFVQRGCRPKLVHHFSSFCKLCAKTFSIFLHLLNCQVACLSESENIFLRGLIMPDFQNCKYATLDIFISSVSQYVKIVQVRFGCCCFTLFGLNAEIYGQFTCKPLYTPDIRPKFTMIKTPWISIRTSERTFHMSQIL